MNVAQKIKLPAFAMGQRSKSPTHKRRSRRAKGKYIRTVWSCRHHGINYLPIRAPTCARNDKMEWKVPDLPDRLVIFKREKESSLGSLHSVFFFFFLMLVPKGSLPVSHKVICIQESRARKLKHIQSLT